MADFEPPSFSLGLDLDTQSNPRIPTRPLEPSPQAEVPSSNAGVCTDHLDELEREEVMDSDPEPEPKSARVLKRLRRGPGAGPTNQSLSPSSGKKQEIELRTCWGNGDDEIEEFSSPEDLLIRDEHPSVQKHSVCSSSKIPLRGQGVLTTQSSSQWKARKRVHASDAPSSASLSTSQSRSVFPKLTISPLRRFQLLDSDSDSDYPCISVDVSKGVCKIDQSSKEPESTASKQKKKVLVDEHQNEDLWKDFCPTKSFHIRTPVLDEVCEEYFQSVQDKNAAQDNRCLDNNKGSYPKTNSCWNLEQCWDSAGPLPPAHQYFLHDDPRIQKLVCSRLPHFFPLGVIANRRNQQRSTSVIDYMSQFNNKEASKQKGTREINSNKSSMRGRKKLNKSNAEEVLPASGGWVDPKSSSTIPKDAGKRRVHANGQSGGHWYTSPEGRKVYISRSGQELTGQIAYRQYRKENGAGFKKSKKKTSSKKKKA